MTRHEFKSLLKLDELAMGDVTECNEKDPPDELTRRIFKFDGRTKDQVKIKAVGYSWDEVYDKLPESVRKRKKEVY